MKISWILAKYVGERGEKSKNKGVNIWEWFKKFSGCSRGAEGAPSPEDALGRQQRQPSLMPRWQSLLDVAAGGGGYASTTFSLGLDEARTLLF